MGIQKNRFLQVALAVSALMLGAAQSHAQYPDRPIRMVVPIAAGGGTDLFARVVSNRLSGVLGQQVIVENKPGAGFLIGIRDVVKSPPDGYKLLFVTNTPAIDEVTRKEPEFRLMRDLTPVSSIATLYVGVVVPAALPVNNLREYLAYAKANQGKLNYASSGQYTFGHLITARFLQLAGVQMTHVPYAGNGPAMDAIMGNHVQLLMNDTSASMAAVQANKARILAIGSPKRLEVLSDIPTIDENGFPGFVSAFKFWVFGPAGLPADILNKLNASIQTVLRSPEVQEDARKRGYVIDGGAASEFREVVESEIRTMVQVVKDMNLPQR